MLGRSILAILTYIIGLVVLVVWSIHGFLTDAPREDWALMIVLPLAWGFSYWPMLGSLVMIARVRGLQRTLEGVAAELEAGIDPSPDKLLELEEAGTKLAARENRLPEFIVRPIVRKVLSRMVSEVLKRRDFESGRENPANE